MIAVIFEVIPNEGKMESYLHIAAELAPKLKEIEGFISVERFQSLSEPGKLLSLSFWRDEASIAQWRNVEMHRNAQSAGRATIFLDYRLRIADVNRDYGKSMREEAPDDSRKNHG
jgi:heme-degrading monooxygenase HmoA